MLIKLLINNKLIIQNNFAFNILCKLFSSIGFDCHLRMYNCIVGERHPNHCYIFATHERLVGMRHGFWFRQFELRGTTNIAWVPANFLFLYKIYCIEHLFEILVASVIFPWDGQSQGACVLGSSIVCRRRRHGFWSGLFKWLFTRWIWMRRRWCSFISWGSCGDSLKQQECRQCIDSYVPNQMQ